MTPIEKKLKISAPIEKVWAALTDAASIESWMGNDSVTALELKVGGKYAVFGGSTIGAFTAIKAPNTLEYTWRQAEWPKAWKDSVVRWKLRRSGKSTLVHLVHSKFPNKVERAGHDEGWDMYWLGPMKEWLEK